MATGIMYRNGLQLKCVMVSKCTGQATQEADATPEKSTLPMISATM